MNNSKIAIFGFPRSATKLLANIYEQHGYTNLGEFFDTFTNDLIFTDIPVASRKPISVQATLRNIRKRAPQRYIYDNTLECQLRLEKFQQISTLRTTVTVWPENFELFPELMDILHDRYFLCTRRQNIFDQLISRALTAIHLNYNAEVKSTPVIIPIPLFNFFFFKLKRTERLQDYFVSNNRGQLIDFDALITGNANVGFTYSVNSDDEHPDLYSLVLNLDNLKKQFTYLVDTYN